MGFTDQKLSRRFVLTALAGSAGAAALAACQATQATPTTVPATGANATSKPAATTAPTTVANATPKPAATAAPAAAGRVKVSVSVWGTVADESTYVDIIKSFNASQTKYTADHEQFLGNYYDKLQTALAGKAAPDVLYFQGWSWQPYADKNVLVPLDSYIKSDNYTTAWPNIPNYVDNEKWNGKTYLSSVDTGPIVIYYNKKLFDQFQVPYPKPDWTYEEFQQIVEKMTRKVNDVQYYGFALAGGWNGDYNRASPWIRMDHELEWDEIVQPKQAKFLQPEIVSALQYILVDTIAKGLCPSPSTITGGGVSISTGRVALTPEGPWELPLLQGPQADNKDGGIQFEVVPFPKGKTGYRTTSAEVHGHTINMASKNPDAAWALLRYCTEDKAQQIVAQYGRMCNTPDAITKFWVPIAQKNFNFTSGDVFTQSMETGLTPEISGAGANMDAISQSAGTPLAVAWDAMVNGTPAAKALGIANPAVQAILDNYWRNRK